MEMGDQRLKASFVNKIAEVTYGCAHDKKENDCAEDDGDLNPFQPGDEGDGKKEDITCKRDKDGNEESILIIEREVDIIVPDGEKNNGDH